MKVIHYTIIIIHDKRLKKGMLVVKLSSPKTGSVFAAKLAIGVQIRDRVPGQTKLSETSALTGLTLLRHKRWLSILIFILIFGDSSTFNFVLCVLQMII